MSKDEKPTLTTIDDIEFQFKDLQEYSDKQFHLIIDLKRQIETLNTENQSLKKMLEGNLPDLSASVSSLGFGISNEQLICETQILLLKNRATMTELTIEEAKKLDIYYRILADIKKESPKQDEHSLELSKLSEEDLLKIVNIGNP